MLNTPEIFSSGRKVTKLPEKLGTSYKRSVDIDTVQGYRLEITEKLVQNCHPMPGIGTTHEHSLV